MLANRDLCSSLLTKSPFADVVVLVVVVVVVAVVGDDDDDDDDDGGGGDVKQRPGTMPT